MSTLFPKVIEYISRSGSYQEGIWVTGSDEKKTFIGSVQPASGKDTEFLPQARRDTGSVKLYSGTPLKVPQEGSEAPGDIVIWQGRLWEIVTALNFQNDLIPHYKYLATDIGEAE